MPTYSFVCETCGAEFDRFVSFKDNPDEQVCPNGHTQVRRVFTPPAIVFKGSGFYVTDNRSSSKSASGSTGTKSSSESDKKNETKSEKKETSSSKDSSNTKDN